ncbi:hypothetical protein J2X12_003851 [Pseudarthrobacter oxydans]|uniref:Uncharacterized protein n=1 Tax=Pseudarthrobacter oxydans TaxID=1671 RepID=A0AAW8NI64_PSEOX|nr:hypothetical protein [Pseudarthrobacter oxydans]MDR6794456.1 hypothetical protein [Pseudarthrobacter oxydans]MDR7165797.1 hypothetical protein [Pseudarthrobacter oxydans]
MSDTAGTRSDAFVDELLLEAGMDDDGRLRPALLELRALADTPPEPSAAIGALMAPAGAAAAVAPAAAAAAAPGAAAAGAAPCPAAPQESPRVDELAARRRAKRRIALTTLSVAVSLGAGGAVAAASDQGIRDSLTQLNHTITSFVTGSGASPAGHQGEQPAAPLPTAPAATAPAGTAPAGAAPGGPASVPGDPAEATQPAAAPPSDGAVAPEAPAGQGTTPGKPGDIPAPGAVPGNVPGHVADGLGKAPEVPVPTQVPLPGNLPSVPLP